MIDPPALFIEFESWMSPSHDLFRLYEEGSTTFFHLRPGRPGCVCKLRFIANGETGGRGLSHAQEVGIVFVKRADGGGAWRKAESLVIVRLAQDEQRLAFDRFLSQGKADQLGPDPLLLKVGGNGHGRQVQAATVLAMVGVGKGDVGDDLVGVDADPFMFRFVVRVKSLHQRLFILTARKGAAQECVDFGLVFCCDLPDLHGLCDLVLTFFSNASMRVSTAATDHPLQRRILSLPWEESVPIQQAHEQPGEPLPSDWSALPFADPLPRPAWPVCRSAR